MFYFYPSSKILNEIIEKQKAHGDKKKSLGYLSDFETPTSGKTTFVKHKGSSSLEESLLID